MNRRSALLVALAVGLATLVALVLARRRTAAAVPTAPVAPVGSPAPTPAPAQLPPVTQVPPASSTPLVPAAPPPAAGADLATGERPLPGWARVAIVGAALLAFLAVSLIATRSS